MTTNTELAASDHATLTAERADLLASLHKHRFFLRLTTRGLIDEQAALRPTVSELCLGGLIKHVTQAERNWSRFILEGPSAMPGPSSEEAMQDWADGHRMLPGETLAEILDRYEETARRTDELVATVDLDASQPLPTAPWFEPGGRWSARRVFLHLMGEIAQHAGHADIIRETIDGQKSMG
jgi:hypothetical protein